MPEASDKKGILLQNLEDAGCSQEMIQDCLGYAQEHRERNVSYYGKFEIGDGMG